MTNSPSNVKSAATALEGHCYIHFYKYIFLEY